MDAATEPAPRRVSARSRLGARTLPASADLPRRGLALMVLCVSILVVNLDTTILNVALPTLVRKLGATSSELQWIVDAYALVYAGCC
jgi:hypothetical protein